MGEVYLARDTKLDREVAIKVLPEEFASDDERLARFEREAKALAALNHPGIVTVYSVEEAGGLHFIAMELVRGKTLSTLLPRNGFSSSRFFDIAIQLADAVAAAHQFGITHRDLKPDNVIVSDEGRVKVLDFGLAKQSSSLASGSSELPTQARTREGVIVGTPHYMSPEQALGGAVDSRSDIFSLGVVLYLMATGRHPFEGRTPTAILSAIITDTPASAAQVNPRVPGLLARTIGRCLEKDPEDRLQSAKDLRNELRELKQDAEAGVVDRERTSGAWSRKRKAVLVAAFLLGGMSAYLLVRASRETPGGTAGRATSLRQLTSQAGRELFPSLSPDGDFVAYASDARGNWDIYLQRVGGENAVNLTEDSPSHDTHPAFSPDGERIAFRSERDGGGIFLMGATGESVRRLTDVGCSPAWSPDGLEIAFAVDCGVENPHSRAMDSELWTVNVASGETRVLTETDAVQPSWSPGGSTIAFWSIRGESGEPIPRSLWTIPAKGGERTSVTEHDATDWNPVWSPDGRFLYFSSDRGGSMNLWRVEMDEDSGEPLRTPTIVTIGATASHQHPSFSADGRTLAYVESIEAGNHWRLAFDPSTGTAAGAPSPVTAGSRLGSKVDVSPDGQRLAYYDKGSGRENIYVVGVDGQGRRQLLDDPYKNMVPRWSADGKKIAFYSNRSGAWELWTIDPDGSGLRKLTDARDYSKTLTAWSPDGSRMAYHNRADGLGYIFDPNRPWSEQTPTALPAPIATDEPLQFLPHSWSPDGRSIGGVFRNEAGGHRVAVYDLETETYLDSTAVLTPLTSNETEFPCWLPDGSGLVFIGREKTTGRRGIYLSDPSFREVREILPSQDATTPRVSPDGRWIYYSRDTFEADIWLLTFEDS